jgi:hypothetical protein
MKALAAKMLSLSHRYGSINILSEHITSQLLKIIVAEFIGSATNAKTSSAWTISACLSLRQREASERIKKR